MNEELEDKLSLNPPLSLTLLPQWQKWQSPFYQTNGGGGAYIDSTVDTMSFVIFVIRSVGSLSVDRQNHER